MQPQRPNVSSSPTSNMSQNAPHTDTKRPTPLLQQTPPLILPPVPTQTSSQPPLFHYSLSKNPPTDSRLTPFLPFFSTTPRKNPTPLAQYFKDTKSDNPRLTHDLPPVTPPRTAPYHIPPQSQAATKPTFSLFHTHRIRGYRPHTRLLITVFSKLIAFAKPHQPPPTPKPFSATLPHATPPCVPSIPNFYPRNTPRNRRPSKTPPRLSSTKQTKQTPPRTLHTQTQHATPKGFYLEV